MKICPVIVTSPLASMTTGLLFELRRKVICTPLGMFTVVKLNMPPSGTTMLWLAVGAKAPSAPVEPLLKVLSVFCARAADAPQTSRSAAASASRSVNRRIRRIRLKVENIAFFSLSVWLSAVPPPSSRSARPVRVETFSVDLNHVVSGDRSHGTGCGRDDYHDALPRECVRGDVERRGQHSAVAVDTDVRDGQRRVERAVGFNKPDGVHAREVRTRDR